MTFLADFFEMPALLLHLVLVAGLAGLCVIAVRNRRRRLAPWPRILLQSETLRRGWRAHLAVTVIGLTCLVVAMAGPFGGEPEPIKEVPGRDLMIVVDVSRSMAAEQPSRLDKALRALRTLTADKRLPAGTRVGLVVFGARPWLAFPLTRDFDHLAATLDQFVAGEFPLDVRGDPEVFVSGTRLGAALKLAAESFPTPRPGRQDIVLLSDGDDPVADDEWLQGVTVARTSGLPVHVVAVGERGAKATIPYRGDILRFEGDAVTTSVQSARLEEIAERTGGLSLALERGDLPLATLIGRRWSETPRPDEAAIIKPATGVRAVRRFPWLFAALLAFAVNYSSIAPPQWLALKRAGRVAVGVACLAFVSAEFNADGMTELRRGQEAFARQDFATAVDWFDKAQPLLADPGLAAFNRGAAYFRLGQFAEAVQAYGQALDDAAIPVHRRDRARFDLGNSLLHQAGTKHRRLVEEAIAAYKQCLAGSPDATLKRDAEFNLAIAGQRLLAIQPPPDPPGSDSQPTPGGAKDPDGPDPANSNPSAKSPSKLPEDPSGGPSPDSASGEDSSKKSTHFGKTTVLPDQPEIEKLSPEQVAAALAAHSERIFQERRRDRQSRDVALPHGKDW